MANTEIRNAPGGSGDYVVLQEDTENGTTVHTPLEWLFGGPVKGFTVVALPALNGFVSTNRVAFATDGRKVGEGAGNGTGVMVFGKNVSPFGFIWVPFDNDGTEVQA